MLYLHDFFTSYQRGKFRPRLTEMVQTNSPELVEGTSKKAFKKLPNVGAAIKELIPLKAVGPATASGKHLSKTEYSMSSWE